ncbi:polyketide synthase [Aspergillus ustus]|uniref:Polyketide synthase n=1 Tax=Aspergillus ustus TaxID=40382 RepID=A0A0C1BW72_ASPUT|nr:polyketide synthase [Aspergillus ustus]
MTSFEPTLVASHDRLNTVIYNDLKDGITVTETAFQDGSSERDESPSASSMFNVDRTEACIVGMGNTLDPVMNSSNTLTISYTACRLPGGIRSPSDLWTLLKKKQSAQGRVPADRYNIDGFYHEDGKRAGAMNVDGGYFLDEDVRQFDNLFFGINNLEASYMDPQQRKLLEVVFECLEHAGVSMSSIAGTNTAVLTLDTACSSSIYALHHAVTAIKNGDCDGAIVAGANLITSPEQHLGTARGGFLSPTSTCHTFDASADGYARAEGVNAIYIKRVSAAMEDENKVYAVIRGTAINANGKGPGITLPSATMQETVIRQAYRNGGLDFAGTDYVECHGTGTAVGDPIEVDALASCFGCRPGQPLRIGSVKTNLGHSEAASGLTSIMKVALAFEHGEIPATYGVKNLNPKLKLQERNMKVLTANEAWPRALQRASINSFGYGGANGHVILESIHSYLGYPAFMLESKVTSEAGPMNDQIFVLPFSAASTTAMSTRRQQIVDTVASQTDRHGVEALSLSMAKREARLRLRDAVIVTANPKPTIVSETQLAAKQPPTRSYPLPFAFVFTGQGAQYPQMAKALLEQSPSFNAKIRELDQVLQFLPPHHAPTWTLEQTIMDPPGTSKVSDASRSQPLCTAIQIGLVDLLRGWKVNPAAVVGHSSGEIAAFYAAGLLTAAEAILVAYFRGVAVAQMSETGAMMAAGISAESATALIANLDLNQIQVACVNAPTSVTLSGSKADIQMLEDALRSDGKFCRRLETGGRAYHSRRAAKVGGLYQELMEQYVGCKYDNKDELPVSVFCSVGHTSADRATVDRATNMASYFRQNLEQPVQFHSALASLLTTDKFHLIEIGPHSALKGPVQQIRAACNQDQDTTPYSPSLVRNEDANMCLKTLAASLFSHGHNLNWLAVNAHSQPISAFLQSLPPYPWDYSNELPWHEPRASVDIRNRKYLRHELLGTQTAAGNGMDWSWRNILRLSEMPWLRDHKLQHQVVLPGSAYVAIAIEALSQIQDIKGDLVSGQETAFEAQNISISAPFVVCDDNDAQSEHMELHTVMAQRKISTANASGEWYEFSISSWVSGHTTLHCSGSIRVVGPRAGSAQGGIWVLGEGYDAWAMGPWYKKTREEGLNFGPHFESLTSLHTDADRVSADAIATTHLSPPSCTGSTGLFYAIHPITLDACFQAAIMGGTAGNLSKLRAFVPTFISECRIQLPAGGAASVSEECKIHSSVEKTGFSTCKVNCTLRNPDGTPVVDIRDLRMSLYTGKAPAQQAKSPFLQRQPCLRIGWQPDIERVASGSEAALNGYVAEFAAQQQLSDLSDNESLVELAALLDLAGHKLPRMRVLEVTHGCQCVSKQCLAMLGKNTGFPRCRTWVQAFLDETGEIIIEEAETAEVFDVLIVPHRSTAQSAWNQAPERLMSLIADRGIVITRHCDKAVDTLELAGCDIVRLKGGTMLAVRRPISIQHKDKDLLIIKPRASSSMLDNLATFIEGHLRSTEGVAAARTIRWDDLDGVELSNQVTCVSLLELENEILATLNAADMNRLRRITDTVGNLIWLTGANMLGSPHPDLTLSSGLSRALMLEQPSLRFTVLDIGNADLAVFDDRLAICTNIASLLLEPQDPTTSDTEFIQFRSLLYISRFAPDMELNSLFRQRLHAETPQSAPLAEIAPAQLSIRQVGMTDTMHFQQICAPRTTPPAGYVDVELKAVSLNAKDIYAMSGRVETRAATTALDFAGVVTAVGPPGETCGGLRPGDRVVGLAPNHFGTTERVPVRAVHKMLPHEEFTVMPTLLTVYSTALFALRDRAQLRAGESVLIHAGAGAFGLAAIAMAQHLGATVYTTVGSEEKRAYLVNEMGVPDERIFNSRDSSFVDGIKAVTAGKGVDVIVNSLVGDLMHASWACIAPFGRFVEIGKRELTDAGKLDMHVFLKNTTFTAFDLSEFYYAENPYYQDIFYGLIADVLGLYRAGRIAPPPVKTFDVSEIAQAYRYFNNKTRIGKVVVSMEDPQSRVPIALAQYKTLFHPDKVYLLVGCLGGLGRSLTRWMTSRGARKFVFLGRSGCDKPTAHQLVSSMRKAGAIVSVVRGDVSDQDHVREAVLTSAAAGPIGGVVQAAMGLKEALFTTMTNEAWQTGIQPKWRGSWNLHHALTEQDHDKDLDFFLLTSSLSGSCGTATESNYCAANSFLDAFAHWRRAQGKTAVSVGLGMISEVGYLHENPEIEALLLRKGIQPLSEEEFLQVVDLAISGPGGEADFAQSQDAARKSGHILTGLEPNAIRELMKQGFDVSNGIMDDARTSLLAGMLLAEQDENDAQAGAAGAGGQGGAGAIAEWMREVPASAAAMFAAERDADSMLDAILRLATRRFSNLILVPVDQVDKAAPLPSFGVDSMLAAEFRTWFWNTFAVDVPYLDIVSPQTTLSSLSAFVGEKLVSGWAT